MRSVEPEMLITNNINAEDSITHLLRCNQRIPKKIFENNRISNQKKQSRRTIAAHFHWQ